MANKIEQSFPGLVVEVEKKIIKDGVIKTDLDVVLKNHVIEVFEGSGKGKTIQLLERIIPNSGGKEVVVFAPEIGGTLEKGLTGKGIKVFKELDKLVNYVAPQ